MAMSKFSHIAAVTEEELKIARYMNYIQFAGDCWARDFDYEEYAFHANRLKFTVLSEEEYKRHCKHLQDEMDAFFVEGLNKPEPEVIDIPTNPLN